MIIGTFGEGKVGIPTTSGKGEVGIPTSFLLPLSDTHSIMDATNSYNHLIWIKTVTTPFQKMKITQLSML